jgi:hypothetical protein
MRALALLLLVGPEPAEAQELDLPALRPSIPMSELQTLPERELARRVLGPLEPFPYVGHRGFSALHGMGTIWFWSEARAGGHAGICRTDRLTVSFETSPVSHRDRDNPAMSPARFDMQAYYVVEDEKEAFGPYSPAERNRWALDAACRKRDPRRDSIPADSGRQLVQALTLVDALGAAARQGRPLAPIDCTHFYWNEPGPTEKSCLAELSRLGRSSVHWVKTCRPRREAPGGCINVMVEDRFIEFDLSTGGEPIRIVIEAMEDMSQAG